MVLAELPRPAVVFSERSFFVENREEFSQEELLARHRRSLETILAEQNPVTGLFPAAVFPHVDLKARMHDAWVRDNAVLADALGNPYSQSIAGINQNQKELINSGKKAAEKWLHSQTAFFAEDVNLFKQRIAVLRDDAGKRFRCLTSAAPPIHSQTDGQEYEWPEPNQPDSFGFYLIALAGALEQGMKLSMDEQITVGNMVSFLSRADLCHLQQTSMWEWGKVYDPPPISSIALVTHGLHLISPFMIDSTWKQIKETVHKGQRFVREKYPYEYTCPEGHYGKTDLATLVAMGHGAMDYVDPQIYFTASDTERRIGDDPGGIRYIGDHYYRGSESLDIKVKEARWLLDELYRANIGIDIGIDQAKRGNLTDAKIFQAMGHQFLRRATNIFDKYGYAVELLYYNDEGKLVPNINHLLWNEAMIVNVTAKSLYLSDLADRLSLK